MDFQTKLALFIAHGGGLQIGTPWGGEILVTVSVPPQDRFRFDQQRPMITHGIPVTIDGKRNVLAETIEKLIDAAAARKDAKADLLALS